MVIYGIGTDIVRIARMEADVVRYGERFARRILTPEEYKEYQACAAPGRFLAKRFAAKEAAVKALGVGFRDGLNPRHIGVAHDARGRPYLAYNGRAESLCRAAHICDSHLSIADESEYAIAFVTLVSARPAPTPPLA